MFLAGPTAVGKSAVAIHLAEHLRGEVVSVDSMQVYRGLDIGTAKLSLMERKRIPHHLIDVIDLTTLFDAEAFVRLARAAIAQIQSKGHTPIFCGGTGLYFKALLEGLGEAPPAAPELRAQLEDTPVAELLAELKEKDPAIYQVVDRSNRRRVLRALEVIRLTGKPFSSQRAKWTRLKLAPGPSPFWADRFFGLRRARVEQNQRIDQRIEQMFEQGLVEETKQLLARGLASNHTAMQAIGYRQVAEYLQGKRSLAETIQLVKQRTRQFAKRQMTWFSRQAPVAWIDIALDEKPEVTSQRILKHLRTFATAARPLWKAPGDTIKP